MTALARPDAARFRAIPADDAGEWYHEGVDGLVAILRATNQISARQADAARWLAALYGQGGYASSERRGGGGRGSDCVCPANGQCECRFAVARAELRGLIEGCPRRLQDGLWHIAAEARVVWRQWLPVWREGLDLVADRLKLPY